LVPGMIGKREKGVATGQSIEMRFVK